MKDIYGEDYLIISRYDLNKLHDRIKELEKQNKEMHNWICDQAKRSNDLISETVALALKCNSNGSRI